MAGRSRPQDGVASLAYVPAIHAFLVAKQGVDAGKRPGMTNISVQFPSHFARIFARVPSISIWSIQMLT
jgi:hypothetical protein